MKKTRDLFLYTTPDYFLNGLMVSLHPSNKFILGAGKNHTGCNNNEADIKYY